MKQDMFSVDRGREDGGGERGGGERWMNRGQRAFFHTTSARST